MRPLGRQWLLLVLGVIVFSLGLAGCNSTETGTEESSTSARIILAAQFSEDVTDDDKAVALAAAIDTIKQRLDAYGVAEAVVEEKDSDRILVKVKRVSSLKSVQELVQKTGRLEFREVEMNDSRAATLNDYLSEDRTKCFDSAVPGSRVFYLSSSVDYVSGGEEPVAILDIAEDGRQAYTDKDGNLLDKTSLSGSTAVSWMPALGTLNGEQTPLTGAYLSSAMRRFSTSETGVEMWAVAIDWSSDGWEVFNSIAARLYGKAPPQNELGILLDNELISSPTVQTPWFSTAQISGNFDAESSNLLAAQLTSGMLPVPLRVVSVSPA